MVEPQRTPSMSTTNSGNDGEETTISSKSRRRKPPSVSKSELETLVNASSPQKSPQSRDVKLEPLLTSTRSAGIDGASPASITDDKIQKSESILHSSVIWTVLVSIIHFILCRDLRMNTRTISVAVAASYRDKFGSESFDHFIQNYRTLIGMSLPNLGSEESSLPNKTPHECSERAPLPLLNDTEFINRVGKLVRQRQIAQIRKDALDDVLVDHSTVRFTEVVQKDTILTDITPIEDKELQEWEKILETVESAVNALEAGDRTRFSVAQEALNEVTRIVPSVQASYLFDSSMFVFPVYGKPGECEPVLVEQTEEQKQRILKQKAKRKEYVTIGHLQDAKDYVKELAQRKNSELMDDPKISSSVRKWLKDVIQLSQDNNNLSSGLTSLSNDLVALKIGSPLATYNQSTTTHLTKASIDKHVETFVQHAQQYDFASIHTGGSVIEHKTSPSLVDNLPLFNKLLSKFRVRFYGYQTRAALTATGGERQLGQCWSFEQHAPTEGQIEGIFATLSVKLSKAINVKHVVIEHSMNSSSPGTAIKKFRVYGFEEPDASGYAWELGSFMYDVHSPKSVQQFQMASRAYGNDVPFVYGNEIPQLQSISLAIDSNWGESYSCLYRFRVHNE